MANRFVAWIKNIMHIKHTLQPINLGDYTNITDVEDQKKHRTLIHRMRHIGKKERCCLCENHRADCKSHSIPRFCLKTLSQIINKRNVCAGFFNAIGLTSYNDEYPSAKQAGLFFNVICQKCDQTYFREYENPHNYNDKPTTTMLAQIALKNHLKALSKWRGNAYLYSIKAKRISELPDDFPGKFARQQIVAKSRFAWNLNIAMCQEGCKYAKRILDTHEQGYNIFYYRRLEYIAPMAVQCAVAVIFDLKGNVINDVFDCSEQSERYEIHIAVLPMNSYTVVIGFVETRMRAYDNFIKQFSKLNPEEQLSLIHYIILLYCDDGEVFFPCSILPVIQNTPSVYKTICASDVILGEWSEIQHVNINMLKEKHNLNNFRNVPNLLDERYKIDR